MANLSTNWMGIPLANPLVAGASNLTSNIDTIKRIEDAGAGAVVTKSLFEEQIQLQDFLLQEGARQYDNLHTEMTTVFPEMKDPGPDEHLMWVRKAKESVRIPVIGSINAVNAETWVEYAKLMAQTGVDGLELNFFSTITAQSREGADIEQEQQEIVRKVKAAVSIPVSVKLSLFYTNPLKAAQGFANAGARGLVLFNRFFEPVADIEKEVFEFPFNLSQPSDSRVATRFVGLLSGKTTAGLCASHGIHDSTAAIGALLAGADCFQVVSTLYRNSIEIIQTIVKGIDRWMNQKHYAGIGDFKGKLDAARNPDTMAYRRAQYVKLLLHPMQYLNKA